MGIAGVVLSLGFVGSELIETSSDVRGLEFLEAMAAHVWLSRRSRIDGAEHAKRGALLFPAERKATPGAIEPPAEPTPGQAASWEWAVTI